MYKNIIVYIKNKHLSFDYLNLSKKNSIKIEFFFIHIIKKSEINYIKKISIKHSLPLFLQYNYKKKN